MPAPHVGEPTSGESVKTIHWPAATLIRSRRAVQAAAQERNELTHAVQALTDLRHVRDRGSRTRARNDKGVQGCAESQLGHNEACESHLAMAVHSSMSCDVGVGCLGHRLCTRLCRHCHAGRCGRGGEVMSQRPRLAWDAETNRTMASVAIILICVASTVTWASVGVSMLFTEEPISVRGVVAYLAFVMAGIGAGVLLASFEAGYLRRHGRAVPAPGSDHAGLFTLLLGLMLLGLGMESALQVSPSGWTLFELLFCSVMGGLAIGAALIRGGRGKTEGISGEVLGQYGPGSRAR